jgi:hypothetical protein
VVRKLHLLWKHLMPSHAPPSLSGAQSSDFPDCKNPSSMHPRLLVPFLSPENRITYVRQFVPRAAESSATPAKPEVEDAWPTVLSASLTPAPSTSALRNFGRRLIAPVQHAVTEARRKREELAAAQAKPHDEKMWMHAKTAYLNALTRHFHPVRHVDVAVRPIDIRFLYVEKWNNSDHQLEEWSPSRRL